MTVKDSILSFDHSFILLSQASGNEAPDSNIVENEFDFLDSVSLLHIL